MSGFYTRRFSLGRMNGYAYLICRQSLQQLIGSSRHHRKKLKGLHERPFPGKPGKVESQEISLEAVVKGDELAVASGAKVPAGHVDVVNL